MTALLLVSLYHEKVLSIPVFFVSYSTFKNCAEKLYSRLQNAAQSRHILEEAY